MTLSDTDISTLEGLEESLWKTETRFDLNHQESVFAPDFFEFGRSGRIYSRSDAIRTDGRDIKARLPLKALRIHALDDRNVLVTYVSEVQYEVLEKANRSSLWSRTDTGWHLRFHQATPVK